MSILNNDSDLQQFPFTSYTPFPVGLIQNIQIVLKDSSQVPFVSTIGSSQGVFTIQLQTRDSYLGTFSYSGSLWLTLNNQHVFGFVKLTTLPVESFNFSGKWYLRRPCYNYAVQLKGLQQVCFDELPMQSAQILDLQFTGDFAIQRSSDSAQVFNIGRNADQTYGQYTQGGYSTQDCVTTIQGFQRKELIFQSSDSSIIVKNPVEAGTGVYIMYINTTEQFKNCDPSDSNEQ